MFLEIFAGCSRLSKAFKQLGWHIQDPIEAFRNEVYDPEQDVTRKIVFNNILKMFDSVWWLYCHIGMPCSSWSRINVNMNGGTRTYLNPWGDGSLERGRLGNVLACVTFSLIRAAHAKGFADLGRQTGGRIVAIARRSHCQTLPV